MWSFITIATTFLKVGYNKYHNYREMLRHAKCQHIYYKKLKGDALVQSTS